MPTPILAASAALLLALCTVGVPAQHRLAIVGGTVVDVRDRGRSTDDIEDAVVLVRDGTILAVGPASRVAVPDGYRVLDASGGFVAPGLIDSFAVLNNQAYANAYLYMGVTSLVGVEGGRRGPMQWDADPSPQIYPLEDVGYEVTETDALLARVDELADRGVAVALLMYRMPPEQLRVVAQRARSRGMATIGELACSDYRDGLDCGVDAFVHTTRYSLDLAPDEYAEGIATEPFSDGLDSPKWRYYRWLTETPAASDNVRNYAADLARSSTALIPTAGLLHLHRPGAVNPWSFEIARLLDPTDINMPADQTTGIQQWTDQQRRAYAGLAANTDRIEREYHAAGCLRIAGSGTDVWGTMPGITLHTELAWFASLGMTPREVLATATSNPADAFRWPEVGHVRAGGRGDLLVLDADPRKAVANLQRIRHVIRRGAVLDRARLSRPPGADDGEILHREPWVPTAELLERHDYLQRVDVESIRYVSNTLGVMGHLAVPQGAGLFPCVVDVRGGNREFGALDDDRVAGRVARIASWGYVVVSTQYRGVAGGDGLEEFGGAEVHDVLNLLGVLDRVPVADAARVGMYSGSRGGMTACLALRRSDRFRALVMRAGVTDMVRWKHERPEMESVFRELIPGYAPGRDELLRARSGVRWADDLCKQTPILLLHGTEDWRVSLATSKAFAEALRKADHPHRLEVLEGADHGLRPRRDDARRFAREWLDRHVRAGGR